MNWLSAILIGIGSAMLGNGNLRVCSGVYLVATGIVWAVRERR